MKKNIIKLQAHVTEIPKEELKEQLGHLKKSELMRTIIMNEKEYGQCSYDRTLRSLWYSTVKPTLDKLDLLTADDNCEKSIDDWDGRLSRYLSEMVHEGKLTYKDLHIEDESRNRRVVNENCFSPCRNVVVCVEKDTTYKLVKEISELLGCSCYSSKGLSGLGGMESLIRNIMQNSSEPVKDIHFLIMSDYDPAGMIIAQTIHDQAKVVAEYLGLDECTIHSERIGINPDQLTEEELKNNWYTPKGDLDKWVEETGGILGEAKGLEMDAFKPDRIRNIFATSLKSYIDTNDYVDYCKTTYLYRTISSAITPYINEVIDNLMQLEYENVMVTDFDILDYVKEGTGFLPVEEVCFIDQKNILDAVEKLFGNQESEIELVYSDCFQRGV